MYQFIIILQAFNFCTIQKSTKHIDKIARLFKIIKTNKISVPHRRKIYTVERSPHIDKKSREQFEMKQYKTRIELSLPNSNAVQLLYYLVKNSTFPGVQVTIFVQFQGYLLSENK